jgi:hypothetical protein
VDSFRCAASAGCDFIERRDLAGDPDPPIAAGYDKTPTVILYEISARGSGSGGAYYAGLEQTVPGPFFHYAINSCLVASGHAVGPHVALCSACDVKSA